MSECRRFPRYHAVVYYRWVNDKNWPRTRDRNLGVIPALIRGVVSKMIRRSVYDACYGHGIGRYALLLLLLPSSTPGL